MNEQRVEINREEDVVAARQVGRDTARPLGLGSADQTRLATAISELTRNVVQYAGAGACTISGESDDETTTIRVVVEDRGPGIPDPEQAMGQGFSTGGGLGAGLPGTKRLVQEFDIQSQPKAALCITFHDSHTTGT